MRWRNYLVLAALASLVGACAMLSGKKGGLQLDGSTRDKMTRQYVGKDYVLAASLYVSDFFGDSSRLFADARPFDIIKLYRYTGEDVPVGNAKEEIVPAGTAVRVQKLLFPLDSLQASLDPRSDKPLWPTAHTWVVVERTGEGADATPLVLVLPRTIANEQVFEAEMQKRLASQQWVQSWLAQNSPAHVADIYQKKVEPGMSRAAVFAALGEPRNLAANDASKALDFVADYGDLQVTIQGKVVTRVVSKKAEAEAARKEAEEKAAKARAEAEAKRLAEREEREKMEAAKKQKEAEAEKARLAAEAQAAADRQAAEVRRQAELKRAEADAKEKERQAELAARLEAARLAKEEAERERQRRIEEAKAAKRVAEAEAAAVTAKRKADADAAKAEAEAAAARRKLEDAKAKQEAAQGKQKAAEAKAKSTVKQAPPPPRKVGVKLGALDKEKAFDLKLTTLKGALIVAVSPGGAAARAGLKADDVVQGVDGKSISSPQEFVKVVGELPYEHKIALSLWRAGKRVQLSIGPQEVPSTAATRPVAKPRPAVSAPAPSGNRHLMPTRRSSKNADSEAAVAPEAAIQH